MVTSLVRTKRRTSAPEDRIVAEVLNASSEASWCMEFGIPVDVTAPDAEVVRQVFENDPYWSFSNPAMARLYLLPAHQNFNDRPVHEIFPRNARNEEFVLNLIANGFEVDAAPALDARYDGVEIEVENDVRAHIENGRLLRMFGNVRDVGKHRRREAAIETRLRSALDVLGAVPSPVIAVDRNGDIALVNAAGERLLSGAQRDLIGQNARKVLGGALGASTAAEIFDAIHADRDNVIADSRIVIPPQGNIRWTVATGGTSKHIGAVLTGCPHPVEEASND